MEKVYKSSKVDLKEAKEKGISPKVKTLLASAIVAGGLLVSGAPQAEASTIYYGYTNEQVQEYQDRLDEIPNYINATKKLFKDYSHHLSGLDAETLEKNNITPEIVQQALNNLEKVKSKSEKDFSTYYEQAKADPSSIKDKMGISMYVVGKNEENGKDKVVVNMDYVSQLSDKQLSYLEDKYDISSIKLNRYFHLSNDDHDLDGQFTYDLGTYKKLASKMDELLGDIKANPNLNDLDKTVLVMKRIKENVSYDYEAFFGNDVYYKEKVKDTSRNLVGPLLQGKAVCGGLSNLFQQSMAYLDIPSREILGQHSDIDSADFPTLLNHAWNQVQIDGKWYNVDLTNMSQLEKDSDFAYVLTSDNEFTASRINFGKTKFTPYIGNHQEANESISPKQIRASLDKINELEHGKTSSRFSKILNKIRHPFQKEPERLALNPAPEPEIEDTTHKNSFKDQLSQNGKYRKDIEEYTRNNLSHKENMQDKSQEHNIDDFDR